ncbi:MAG: DUF6644 family protein [Acidobacteriota bacterium]
MPFAGYDPANNPLNMNEWAFPVTEVFHILGFALLIGTIMLVDLRLLGFGLKRQSTADVVRDMAPWTMLGLVVVLISGPLIFSSDPGLYVYNQSFRFKITMLILAIIYNWTIHRKVAMSPSPGGAGVLVGGISILMWTSIIFAGIFIAFV